MKGARNGVTAGLPAAATVAMFDGLAAGAAAGVWIEVCAETEPVPMGIISVTVVVMTADSVTVTVTNLSPLVATSGLDADGEAGAGDAAGGAAAAELAAGGEAAAAAGPSTPGGAATGLTLSGATWGCAVGSTLNWVVW